MTTDESVTDCVLVLQAKHMHTTTPNHASHLIKTQVIRFRVNKSKYDTSHVIGESIPFRKLIQLSILRWIGRSLPWWVVSKLSNWPNRYPCGRSVLLAKSGRASWLRPLPRSLWMSLNAELVSTTHTQLLKIRHDFHQNGISCWNGHKTIFRLIHAELMHVQAVWCMGRRRG